MPDTMVMPPAGLADLINAPTVVEVPGLAAWDAPSPAGEMERALRSVPLGLEPPEPPRARLQTPGNPVPQAVGRW
jgi:hypothetical protein